MEMDPCVVERRAGHARPLRFVVVLGEDLVRQVFDWLFAGGVPPAAGERSQSEAPDHQVREIEPMPQRHGAEADQGAKDPAVEARWFRLALAHAHQDACQHMRAADADDAHHAAQELE